MLVTDKKFVEQAIANIKLESLPLSKALIDKLKKSKSNGKLDTTALLKSLRG